MPTHDDERMLLEALRAGENLAEAGSRLKIQTNQLEYLYHKLKASNLIPGETTTTEETGPARTARRVKDPLRPYKYTRKLSPEDSTVEHADNPVVEDQNDTDIQGRQRE